VEIIKNKHLKQKKKIVNQLTIDGELVREWSSVNEIKKIYPHINAVLSGSRKTADGYLWKYKTI
jgi:hypothetical protein